MSQREYFAHYDDNGNQQLLADHVYNVAVAMKNAVPPTLCFPAASNETIQEISFWMGYLHDLGKYTDFFQDYLIKKIMLPQKQHAHISSLYLHGKLLDILPATEEERHRYLVAFLAYLAVRCHHLYLSLSNLFPDDQMVSQLTFLKELWEHLEQKRVEVLEDSGLIEHLSPDDFKRFGNPDTRWRDKRNFLYMPQHVAQRLKNVQWYFFLLYIFSLLIDKDKMNSAGVDIKEMSFIPHHLVPAYLAKKHSGSVHLGSKREEARLSMLGRINALNEEEIHKIRFLTITAPTGLGKTLAALECALLLRERIQKSEKYTPRIISAIPFINIIEQTRLDYEQVLAGNTEGDGKLVIHHSLADISQINCNRNSEASLEKTLLEVESWEGDVILTTFVQLFHSLLTGNNRMLKKINKLAGGIVILDEVQSIPDRYQPLIGAVLRKTAEFYGTRFILMTATQPKILEFSNLLLRENGRREESIELLENHEQYYSQNQRTKLVSLLQESLNTETLISLIQDLRKPGQSVLVVVNTIRRSIELFHAFKKRLKKEPDSPTVLYLSTNIISVQRKRIIKLAKKLLRQQQQPVVMVSTQTIEAGVDLDFDLGFRDLAPLDSLIQTAGRVNREGEKGEYLPVYIVSVEDDAQKVYAFHHIDRTKALLKRYGEILENEYISLIEEYYNKILGDGVSEESKHIWEEGVMKVNFEVLQDFKLINKAGEVVDVFVEMPLNKDSTSLAPRLADAYEEILSDRKHWNREKFNGLIDERILGKMKERPDIFQRKALLKVVRSKINDYVIQIRKYRAAKNAPVSFSARGGVESNLFWVPPAQLEDYYDLETGFKDETGKSYLF